MSGPEQNRTETVQNRTGRRNKTGFLFLGNAIGWWSVPCKRLLEVARRIRLCWRATGAAGFAKGAFASGPCADSSLCAARIGRHQAHWLHASNSGGLGAGPHFAWMAHWLVAGSRPIHFSGVKRNNSSIAFPLNLSVGFFATSTAAALMRPQPPVISE